MIAYLLLCILCVLLAPYIGSWAIGLWLIVTLAVIAADVMSAAGRACERLYATFEDWLAERKL